MQDDEIKYVKKVLDSLKRDRLRNKYNLAYTKPSEWHDGFFTLELVQIGKAIHIKTSPCLSVVKVWMGECQHGGYPTVEYEEANERLFNLVKEIWKSLIWDIHCMMGVFILKNLK